MSQIVNVRLSAYVTTRECAPDYSMSALRLIARPTSMCRSKVNGTELAPMQGPMVVAELVDTVLDAWAMLKWSTKYPSNPFAIQVRSDRPPYSINLHPFMRPFYSMHVRSVLAISASQVSASWTAGWRKIASTNFADAIVRLSQMQGFSPGLCFTGGCTTPVADWRAKFIVDMMAVLGPRLANEVQIEVTDGP
jgi:hypothetical protein